MVDISLQTSGIITTSLLIVVSALDLSGRVRDLVCGLGLAALLSLYVWGLKVPIGETVAAWLVWLNLAMLVPLFYFAARHEFDRKWTVPDRAPERD